MRNILITGIPRAGTTLAASRLDAEPDSICLNEPEWHRPHPSLSAGQFAQAIAKDMHDLRRKILEKEPIIDRRHADGTAPTNYYGPGMEIVNYPLVREGLTPEFTLGIKHNGPYLSVLPELVALKELEIFAVIRHPLPVIRSWRRLKLPVSEGRLPNAVAYWPEMKNICATRIDLLEKQVHMLDAMFARIDSQNEHIIILRYEEFSGRELQRSDALTPEDAEITKIIRRNAPNILRYYPHL
jgi:hypothetical protein